MLYLTQQKYPPFSGTDQTLSLFSQPRTQDWTPDFFPGPRVTDLMRMNNYHYHTIETQGDESSCVRIPVKLLKFSDIQDPILQARI